MKIFVKTLKGTHFVIYVRPHDSVADVKKNIETTQGSDVYPAERLMLIHHEKVLKDPTTLEENQVVENNFIVVMLSKDRHSSAPPTAIQPPITFQAPHIHYPHIVPVHYDPLAPIFTNTQAAPRHIPVAAPQDYYMWDQLASAMPQENHRDLFPQGLPNPNASSGTFDFLRNSQQFQELRALVQQNPHMLQPMLQELARQNPPLMRLIQGHQADFLRLINEHVEGEGNILLQEASAIPQAVTVTLLERQAIERLEAMGFDRARALELFFACNKNEELAANYLLYHMHEFEE